jgi:hypothetical protein
LPWAVVGIETPASLKGWSCFPITLCFCNIPHLPTSDYVFLVDSFLCLVWFICSSIHSFTHVKLDTSITDYNLYITTQLIIYGHPHNTV